MDYSQNQSTWVEIDLDSIQTNVRLVSQQTSGQVMAIVKANGYGHGSVPVARAALQGGATWCGVARISEALELRQAGLGCPILTLGWMPPEQVEQAISQHISMTVWSEEQIAWANARASASALPARLHLKVDTGMSRLGVPWQETIAMARRLANSPGVIFEGLFTHFARADESDKTTTELQETRLRQALSELEALGLRPPLVHAANSPASLTRPSAHFDMVRLGIAMYGLHPSPECPLPQGFRPALTWKAVLSQVKALPPGSGVSYGHEYITQAYERIGTVPIGYADGFRRIPGNQALVGGQRIPVVGRVCMDQIMVQLDKLPYAKAGDEVVLIGQQGKEQITAEEVAMRWNTNNYETVCGIGPRVPRFYINRPGKLS
ncbi:MAG: alanine racemase [Anaerolineales bacterium]|nr:alanine racemase [Anaerolineales bacterium]